MTYAVCGFCKLVRPPSPDDHDPCIVNLPGVMNACCGHGDPNADVYVQFWDTTEDGEHRRISGQAAFAFFALHGKGPRGLHMKEKTP